MNIKEVCETISAIVAERLVVSADRVVPCARFVDELGADSLDVVELTMHVEDRFGIDIPDEAAEKMERVADLTAFVADALAAKAAS